MSLREQIARFCVGVITAAHGLDGRVRVRTLTERPESLAAYGPLSDERGTRTFALTVVGQVRGQAIARIAGVESRGAAEALRGTRLHASRAALPATDSDEYYHGELVGLAVERWDGTRLGTVKAIHDFGAGEVLEVERPRTASGKGGGSFMIPFTRRAVPEMDLKGGRLVVDPPAGLDERPGRRARRQRRGRVDAARPAAAARLE